MSRSYFDVIFLGAELAPLTCAALLAKRGFRVLVLGQGDVPPHYRIGPFSLPRRATSCVGAQSPVMRRILAELGLSQSFRRIASTPSTAFQVALPQHRLDISPDRERLGAEIQREFPEVRRPIEDFHHQAAQLSSRLDEALAESMVWPPETMLERRALSRVRQRAQLPRTGEEPDVLAEFPEGHPFRRVTLAPAYFEGAAAGDSRATLGAMHLYNNLYSRNVILRDGLSSLRSLLIDRIHGHSGEVQLDERATAILLKRNRVHGVSLFGSGVELSAGFVASGIDISAMLRLLPERSMFEELFERSGEPQIRNYRYAINFVVRREGVPQGLQRDLFYIGSGGLRSGPENALHVQRHDISDTHTLISAETLLSAAQVHSQPEYLASMRGRVQHTLRDIIPFMDRHLVLVDSPHDEHPPELHEEGLTLRTEHLGRRGPSTLPVTFTFPVRRALNLCALPTRGPIKNLLLCNGQVIPGLGLEGELLSACSTASVISKTDSSREWMRRGLWTKIEI